MTYDMDYQTIENKALAPAPATGDITAAFDEFLRDFEAFKSTNDDRLAELETRGTADPLTEDKLGRLDKTLDRHERMICELTVRAQRPALAEPAGRPADEHAAAFEGYVRKGDTAAMQRLESKALSVGSEADGGYLVPEANERQIMTALREESPIRAISGAITISTSVLKRPFATSDAASGWVGETDSRPQTMTPTIAELSFPTMELYAMPAATIPLLDDAAVNIETWIASEVRTAFAEQEGKAFVSGDGVNKPKGFLSYDAVSNDNWAWGKLGYIATGIDGDFAPAAPADTLIDLIYSPTSQYRSSARFVMNRLTQSAARKLKDGDGNYLWQPGLSAALQPTLLGYPVTECEDMPDIVEGGFSLAFGDFARGYLVVDRSGIRTLRDPYSSKPYILFYTTKRVGGGVQDFNAIKLLKFAAG